MKKTVLLIVIFLLAPAFLLSQATGFENETGGMLNQKTEQSFTSGLQQRMTNEQLPVGNIVNPEKYYLGPGDILSLQLLPLLNQTLPLRVSSDNIVHVPRIGDVDVLGKTMAEVSDEISKLYKERNANYTVSVSLEQARTCLVTLQGDVTYPAVYTLPGSYQVSTAIKYSNNQSLDKVPDYQARAYSKYVEDTRTFEKMYSNSGLNAVSYYYMRNIKVLHKDGTSSEADIELARALNDPFYDPYVMEGDEIIVPFAADNYPKISVAGAVIRPAILPYKSGDMASHLLKFSYGLTDEANKDAIFLYMPGKEKIRLQVDSDLNLINEDIELVPGSNIIVEKIKMKRQAIEGVVSVKGEVNIPGVYLISEGTTRLKDVIEKAGGFTSEAYLHSAYVLRYEENDKIPENPKREFQRYFRQSPLVPEDTTHYMADIYSKMPVASVDVAKCYSENSKDDNIMLKNGDVIVIPSNSRMVYVYGQVKQPGYVEFAEGKTPEYYVEKAGGYSETADQQRTSVIRSVTKAWIQSGEETLVYAGDEVYVPSPPAYPPSVKTSRYNLYISMVHALVTLVSVSLSVFTVINANKD
jgi:protein involved in polysaccharide export with SLBB domain